MSITDESNKVLEEVNHEIYVQHRRLVHGERTSNLQEVVDADWELIRLREKKKAILEGRYSH